jgi:hypothetical protein
MNPLSLDFLNPTGKSNFSIYVRRLIRHSYDFYTFIYFLYAVLLMQIPEARWASPFNFNATIMKLYIIKIFRIQK